MLKTDLKRKARVGLIVLGALVFLKIVEYVIGVTITAGSWPWLAISAVVGAWLILRYFMHIGQIRHPGE